MKKNKFLLLMPCSLIMLFTVIYPIISTFGYSLKYYKLTDPMNVKFIGFENYKEVFLDKTFHSALINSLAILLLVMVFGSILSLLVGLLLNKKTKITPILTAIVIVPWALPPIVNGIMWKFIFFPGYGLLNKILINLGILDLPVSWINNKYLFWIVISIVIIWRIVPFSAIVILANLQNIPNSYYESIYLEGSSKFQAFKNITLPLLIPSLGVVLINITTTALNVFDEVIAISGYQTSNQTLLVYNYNNTFNFLNFGYGSSISYIIMLVVGLFGYYYVKSMTVEKIY